jgi:hypothetical protein
VGAVDATVPATVDACSAACNVPPPPAACDPLGAYGLMVSADVDWDPTTWIDRAGRGPAQFFILAQIDTVDPQSHDLNGTGRVCGLTLPAMGSSLSCAPFEFDFAESTWEQSALPKLMLSGSYKCDSGRCVLQLDSTSYALGIALDPMHTTQPSPNVSAAQFPDDDADGFPGVSVSVVTSSPLPAQSNPACAAARGYACPAAPDGSVPAQGASQRVLLGLRAQLAAAFELASDCRLDAVSGSMESVELRAAGCGWESPDAGMPWNAGAGTNSACTDEYRSMIEDSLPHYHVLDTGETPSASGSCRDTAPSAGTVVRAVRLPAGAGSVTCQQLRAMF